MVAATATLPGAGSEVVVGRISHGLMFMTAGSSPVPDEQCFKSIKTGVDALPPGAKAFLNAGEFYGPNFGTANLEMLARFYEKYPEYVDKTFLSVKGGIVEKKPIPDCSLENLRKSVDKIQSALGPLKKIDLYEPARVDPKFSIEEQMATLVTLLKEGKFTHIGLSECNANTLRRAHAVHPITAAEIEVSPWEYGGNQKAVIETAKELGICVLAYSPLGRGFLTGQIKKFDDIPEGDHRRLFDKFKEDNIAHNYQLVKALTTVADRLGYTPAQLCIAWVASLGPHVVPLPGSSKASRTLENLEAGDIKLSDTDLAEVNEIIGAHTVKGGRYLGKSDQEMFLWG
ncbi:aldo/keto reductase [Coprinellus micaceus]|uniref:Aldo/keto reductase n=1 Tax=Coprinellus micaceus TaxID=71717 RepID=A0A4Y7TII4_COPMI|nr:aldo/keto reductase [Coprinellus micaceus]